MTREDHLPPDQRKANVAYTYPYNNRGLISERLEDTVMKTINNRCFRPSQYCLMLLTIEPVKISAKPYLTTN